MSSSKKQKEGAKPSAATEINEAMRSFEPYDNGSLFTVMKFGAEVEDRLRQADFQKWKELLGSLARDPATLSPDQHRREEDTMRELKKLLEPYGSDLMDGFDEFREAGYRIVRGSSFGSGAKLEGTPFSQ